MTHPMRDVCISVADYKLRQASDDEQPESLAGELFDIYVIDSRMDDEPHWIIQPALPYGEAITSAKLHAKRIADKTPHAVLHDDPPCLAPTYLCSCLFILPPDAENTQMVSFSLRKAGI